MRIGSNLFAFKSLIKGKKFEVEKYEDQIYNIPTFQLKSNIIKFAAFNKLWNNMPAYIQVRIP